MMQLHPVAAEAKGVAPTKSRFNSGNFTEEDDVEKATRMQLKLPAIQLLPTQVETFNDPNGEWVKEMFAFQVKRLAVAPRTYSAIPLYKVKLPVKNSGLSKKVYKELAGLSSTLSEHGLISDYDMRA